MKVLVATRRGQGGRANDFSFTEEGEPLFRGTLCTRATADDACGCARSLTGARTLKPTTTAEVVDLAGYGVASLALDIRAALARSGLFSDAARLDRAAVDEARAMADLAAALDVGDVIEYRDGRAHRRSP